MYSKSSLNAIYRFFDFKKNKSQWNQSYYKQKDINKSLVVFFFFASHQQYHKMTLNKTTLFDDL